MKNIGNDSNKTHNEDVDWRHKPIFNKESVENSIIVKIIVEIIILIAIYFFLKITEGEVTLFSYISVVAGYLLIGIIRRYIKKKRGSEKNDTRI